MSDSNPDEADDRLQRALALHQVGKLDEASALYREVLAAQPKHADALHFSGMLAYQEGRHDGAIALFRRALAVAPDAAFIHSNLGLAQAATGQSDAAIASFVRAIDIDPSFAAAHFNLGASLHSGGHPEEAKHHYEIALRLQPDYADARWNLADLELSTGDWRAGWEHYAARFERPELAAAQAPWRADAAPEWDGRASLLGKSLLVYPEGGFGDVLMFARFAPMLAARGARVHWLVPRELARISQGLAGIAQRIVFDGVGLVPPSCDFKLALFSLPRVLDITPANVPAEPYLTADTAAIAQWRKRLDGVDPARRFRIGINWAGRADNALEPRRGVPLALLARLGGEQVQLVSMQKGGAAAQLAGFDGIANLGDEIRDFAESAALASALDLVITSDTGLAHLVGALGLPAWVLLHHPCDWRWAGLRADGGAPWYPTLRLFRQGKAGDWESVLAPVQAALREQAGSRLKPN
jgi:tetratricopeptide (TPR) repeat protein